MKLHLVFSIKLAAWLKATMFHLLKSIWKVLVLLVNMLKLSISARSISFEFHLLVRIDFHLDLAMSRLIYWLLIQHLEIIVSPHQFIANCMH